MGWNQESRDRKRIEKERKKRAVFVMHYSRACYRIGNHDHSGRRAGNFYKKLRFSMLRLSRCRRSKLRTIAPGWRHSRRDPGWASADRVSRGRQQVASITTRTFIKEDEEQRTAPHRVCVSGVYSEGRVVR